ncbi:hypothetical protein [Burkholderia anthina]|uniref:hypothetical protein n=1 Tax=Burkholderia anthina TaxID=179879 RepID=UPI001AA03406|nr:hypothetical protein [Burkholderia anthina]QTD91902.1 hypothetical protein J4G50_27015 [Burkholderia anthina]
MERKLSPLRPRIIPINSRRRQPMQTGKFPSNHTLPAYRTKDIHPSPSASRKRGKYADATPYKPLIQMQKSTKNVRDFNNNHQPPHRKFIKKNATTQLRYYFEIKYR